MFLEHWEYYLRLFIALIMGSAIGFERAARNKDAGIKTHALMCLGAAMVMVLSSQSTGMYRDPMRLAAQVVSGIGFIGAGVIWMDKSNAKHGLTTAVNLWVTAALGLMIGYGIYDLAVVSFFLMLFSFVIPKIVKSIVPEEYRKVGKSKKNNQ